MKAEWEISNDVSFLAELKITGVDEGVGVIERLTHQLSSQLGLNIRKFTIEGDEGYFEGTIKLMVKNTQQLERAMQELQNLDNISTVTRVS
ncbi:ACT domain-containing protein [Haliscomenobacter hydrossis]|nr:ACT domain-containing protein [Haliscomenobacter hydrossis]